MSVSLTTINGNVMIESTVTDVGHFDAIIIRAKSQVRRAPAFPLGLRLVGNVLKIAVLKGKKRNCALRSTPVRLTRIWGLVRADLSIEHIVSALICELPGTW